jgi:hypothetical protein
MNYKEELIAYRRERAREALEDAKILVIVHPYGQLLLTPAFRLEPANKLSRAPALTVFACQHTAHSGVRRAGSKVMAKAG